MEKKIGIVTWHYFGNFGSGLQAFALQELLSRMGYNVSIINYRNPLLSKNMWWKEILKLIFHYTIGLFDKRVYEKTLQGTKRYQKQYLRQTKCFTEPERIKDVVNEFSCLVYGSDQIWAPNVYAPIYMGDYVPCNIRKISYAASIGLNDIPDELVNIYKRNLSSFHSVAVREDEGRNLLMNKCEIKANVVLDPTLMIDVETYREMQRPVKGIKGDFIYCYFLNKQHNYRERVEKYAQKYNLQIVGCSDNEADSFWMKRLINIGADQFLWLINNAKAVFTDSYHGSIFSLIFHKNFWTFVRFQENNPICQNSRIRQLQQNFNIGNRILPIDVSIDDSTSIDFEYFEEQLSKLRVESIVYLENALK